MLKEVLKWKKIRLLNFKDKKITVHCEKKKKTLGYLISKGISGFYKSNCNVCLYRWFIYINLFFYIYHL